MKVLVINGSPKGERGNTMKLTRAFLDGAGWADAEIINVSKADVKGCLGCYACWNKTPGKCVLRDEMSDILPKLVAADVLIWSFPLYYYGIPGNLKNLIDRQLPLLLPFMAEDNENGGHLTRHDLTGRRHVVISTCGFWTAQGNYDAVEAMFDHYYGKENYTAIFCGQGELFRVPELASRTDAYLGIVSQAGAEFAAGGIRKETKAEMAEPLYPRDVFEKMADASWQVAKNEGAPSPSDDSFSFTTQMAALYRPDGEERVLEFYYTDIGKTYQILLTKQGSEVIEDNFKQYTTRIETPITVWRSIARGEISGQDALFQRQYKVLGDFSIMLKWDELFGAGTPNRRQSKNQGRKTNMYVLLAPWIIIWVVLAIHATVGGAIGIAAAACVPLLWLVFQPVVFEQISVPVVAGLSLAVLLGADARIAVPLSYLAFGLLWCIGALVKIPLTAHYSAAKYGADSAFDNPIFIQTNRILTAAWGVLYLITPIWTYIIMGTGLSAYIGVINTLCPALMSVFTAWFQKWYPARWARG
ncbi:MAG: flavodoxin family protein [Firmicutes bacterium]|nr:flavodoxin family protein [Bacillota bacterium]